MQQAVARRLRLQSQGLGQTKHRDVTSAVGAAIGVQAQDNAAFALALRVRTEGTLASDVTAALVEDRSIIRTWAMRHTIHLMASDDVRWILALLGPRNIAAGRGRRAQLGLTDDVSARGLRALTAVLAHGPLTRAAIIEGLAKRGVQMDPRSQAPVHLIAVAAMSGLVCGGPRIGSKDSHVLLDDWLTGAKPPPSDPMAELATRYFTTYGPARDSDFAFWTGIPLGQARQAMAAIGTALTEVSVDGKAMWLVARASEAAAGAARSALLLPRFDNYYLGYRDRELILSGDSGQPLHGNGGIIPATVVVNGRIVATWTVTRRRAVASMVVQPLERVDRSAIEPLERECADVGRFLGFATELTWGTGGRTQR